MNQEIAPKLCVINLELKYFSSFFIVLSFVNLFFEGVPATVLLSFFFVLSSFKDWNSLSCDSKILV